MFSDNIESEFQSRPANRFPVGTKVYFKHRDMNLWLKGIVVQGWHQKRDPGQGIVRWYPYTIIANNGFVEYHVGVDNYKWIQFIESAEDRSEKICAELRRDIEEKKPVKFQAILTDDGAPAIGNILRNAQGVESVKISGAQFKHLGRETFASLLQSIVSNHSIKGIALCHVALEWQLRAVLQSISGSTSLNRLKLISSSSSLTSRVGVIVNHLLDEEQQQDDGDDPIITELDLNEQIINNDDCAHIGRLLKGTKRLQKLCLPWSQFIDQVDRVGYEAIADGLLHNCSLIELEITICAPEQDEKWQNLTAVVRALKEANRIKTLSLGSCSDNQFVTTLSQARTLRDRLVSLPTLRKLTIKETIFKPQNHKIAEILWKGFNESLMLEELEWNDEYLSWGIQMEVAVITVINRRLNHFFQKLLMAPPEKIPVGLWPHILASISAKPSGLFSVLKEHHSIIMMFNKQQLSNREQNFTTRRCYQPVESGCKRQRASLHGT